MAPEKSTSESKSDGSLESLIGGMDTVRADSPFERIRRMASSLNKKQKKGVAVRTGFKVCDETLILQGRRLGEGKYKISVMTDSIPLVAEKVTRDGSTTMELLAEKLSEGVYMMMLTGLANYHNESSTY